MKISFGNEVCEFCAPLSVFDAAKEAGLISRAVIAAEVNGELSALTRMLDADA